MKQIALLAIFLAVTVTAQGRGRPPPPPPPDDTNTADTTDSTTTTTTTTTDASVSKFPKKRNDHNSRKLLHTTTVFLTASMYVFIPLFVLLQQPKLTKI